MKKILTTLKNYLCYCGIDKDEYNSLKKEAYVTNFQVWKVLHILMVLAFGGLFINSLFVDSLKANTIFYLIAFIYSIVSAVLFLFILKKDSLIAQFYIYLSIVVLFVEGALVATHRPDDLAVTFMVLLIITPMFMIDKPFFMSFVLVIASTIFLIWMYKIKSYDKWIGDLVNAITFTFVGIFLHIITNSIRIREFVYMKQINIQKDLDDLTGLMNKGAIIRNINAFLATSVNKGILFMCDVDKFKSINDTFGHDVGDDVLKQVGEYLSNKFSKTHIIGRFGGDEFIVFLEGEDDLAVASNLAREINADIEKYIKTPDSNFHVNMTIGIAIYRGEEKYYSEIFKKADIALYDAKNTAKSGFIIN
ncbi:MAG: GGDEF domain-containing protein [Bacilli bacterium]|nr:GGDEF domain-containing protein [Bacilli bacterium]